MWYVSEQKKNFHFLVRIISGYYFLLIQVSGTRTMKYLIACIVLIYSMPLFAQNGDKVNSYQEQISSRRLAEAKLLWATMQRDGFTENTVAALDFTFFSNDKNGVENLVKALSENYTEQHSGFGIFRKRGL